MLAYVQTWLTGDFCRWQIFRNKPGYANTNSNLESFNATIKRDHFKGKVSHISGSITHVGNIIRFYSSHGKKFELLPKFDKNLLKMATKLTKANFTKVDRKTVLYQGKTNKCKLNLDVMSCCCSYFVKNAICTHTVAYSNLYDKLWFGDDWLDVATEFSHKKGPGKSKKTNCYGIVKA